MDAKEAKPSVVLITLTNNGYIDYTLNCLQSLKNVGYPGRVKVYAIGKKAYDFFRSRRYDATLIQDEKGEEFELFRKGNWANVTFYKFEIIHKELSENELVLFTDGDIVFKKSDFMDYCISNIGSADVLIQNDTCADESDKALCSGFMLIRSSQKTRGFFDPDKIKSEIRVGWDDQVYVNAERSKLDFKKLPIAKFPNGRSYRLRKGEIEPSMIHFNWVVGHEKAYDILSNREFQSLYTMFRLALLARSVAFKRAANWFANATGRMKPS